MRPDVVWSKDGDIRFIFEVDRGAYDVYQIISNWLGNRIFPRFVKWEVTDKLVPTMF